MQQINIPSSGIKKRVVVIGAGFGGLTLVKKLAKKNKYQILLIDKNNFHQFQPLFYQVGMSGLEPSSICFPIRKIIQKKHDVFLRVAKVEEVNLQSQTLITDIGLVSYDYLVIAAGARTNYYGNQALEENTLSLKSISDSIYLRNRLLHDYEQALERRDFEDRQGLIDIVIVGGGPTGVELAGALAELKKYILPKEYRELDYKEVDIYLIQSSNCLLKGMSSKSSRKAERFLRSLGVIIKLNTRVTDFDGEYVHTQNGEKIKARKVIWAAGICGNILKGIPEAAIGWGGRIKTDGYHQVEGVQNVFAIGDIAYTETDPEYTQGHPQVAQPAIQMGKHLANYLVKDQDQKRIKPFRYKDKGSLATIGRNKAVCDLPYGLTMTGFFAWIIWLGVHLFALIGVKNKLFVMLNWIWNYLTYDQSLRLIIKPKESAVDPNKTQFPKPT